FTRLPELGYIFGVLDCAHAYSFACVCLTWLNCVNVVSYCFILDRHSLSNVDRLNMYKNYNNSKNQLDALYKTSCKKHKKGILMLNRTTLSEYGIGHI